MQECTGYSIFPDEYIGRGWDNVIDVIKIECSWKKSWYKVPYNMCWACSAKRDKQIQNLRIAEHVKKTCVAADGSSKSNRG